MMAVNVIVSVVTGDEIVAVVTGKEIAVVGSMHCDCEGAARTEVLEYGRGIDRLLCTFSVPPGYYHIKLTWKMLKNRSVLAALLHQS
jgi:hypothetical protein